MIPYSQALRLSGICSSGKDFKDHIDRMKEWFLARDYPDNVVNEQINKVVSGKSQPSRKNSENGILFVVTYCPKVKKLKYIKSSIPYSQTLRLSRICLSKKDLKGPLTK